MSYTYTEKIDGRGMVVQFNGPGLHREYDTVQVESNYTADCISTMLHRAYEAGRKAQAFAMQRALGLVDTPWGIKLVPPPNEGTGQDG